MSIFVNDNAISLLTNDYDSQEGETSATRSQHDQYNIQNITGDSYQYDKHNQLNEIEDSYEYPNEPNTSRTNEFCTDETSLRSQPHDQYNQLNNYEDSYEYPSERSTSLTNKFRADETSLRTPNDQYNQLNKIEDHYEYPSEANTSRTNEFLEDETTLRSQPHEYNYEYPNEANTSRTNEFLEDETSFRSQPHDQYHRMNKIEDSYNSSNYLATNQVGESGRSLCWRLNPSESLSDWKLNIFNRSTKNFEVFHVHRVALAIGPRACEFFKDVFRQAEINKNINRTTRVPLIARSCRIIPCFLDYTYGNGQFEITNENALGLCYLADYFRNHSLWDHATDYIEDDLGTVDGREHLCQYYIDSLYYDQGEFLEHILGVCSRDLLSMIEENISCTNLLGEITPKHLCLILAEMEQPTESSSIYMTRLITEYCCLHRKELSMELFDDFTSRLLVLNSSSAITLLESSLEYEFAPYKDLNTSQDSISSLILFQQQCIGTLSEEWEQLLELDQNRVTRIMRALSLREEHQNILVDWFQKTLIRASNQLSVSRQEKETIQQELSTLKSQHEVITDDLQAAHKATAISDRNHRTTKSEMKTQISSWMRKNEGTNRDRVADEQKWEHERMQWQLKHQRWKHEKSKMNHELKRLRKTLSSMNGKKNSDDHNQHHRTTRNNLDYSDLTNEFNDSNDVDDLNDLTYVSNSSSDNNSLVDDIDNVHGEYINEIPPQLRIL
ncbi:BTB/POZ domain-containing protein [Fragilariopsis cylindrus CCMP1102]|uniref:BTB/POZ domain-containing protein n=1 Tax=Fragilariopsis cylindrus CCMP1102 TaxID=635003 RepID=A0A1E7FGU4_9STRA|nr:BTB/POZ domain-containing protein [Fragilariopsis cylindrus CCMP1102]|eukprot:OEU17354.1 BTB/POZ domain-containing protein [Fragilariopsis cylindrus CCMP1102]